jgi:hypothetical protein
MNVYIVTYEAEGVTHITTAYTTLTDAKRQAYELLREFGYKKFRSIYHRPEEGLMIFTVSRDLTIKIHSRILDGVSQ